MSFRIQPSPSPARTRCPSCSGPGSRPAIFEKDGGKRCGCDQSRPRGFGGRPRRQGAGAQGTVIEAIGRRRLGKKDAERADQRLDSPYWYRDVVDLSGAGLGSAGPMIMIPYRVGTSG